MQDGFSSSLRALKGVKRAIRKAKLYSCPILIVEFKSCGDTLKEVIEEIGDYTKWYGVTKDYTDGSNEIYDAINHFNIPKTLRFCGVETGVCVEGTIRSIIGFKGFSSKQIRLINEATTSHCKGSQKRTAVKRIREMGVRII